MMLAHSNMHSSDNHMRSVSLTEKLVYRLDLWYNLNLKIGEYLN